MAGRGGGSNTTHALLSPDPETLPIGEGVSPSHRRVPGNQGTPRQTDSGIPCSLNGRSQLPSEKEIRPRHYPLGVGSQKWAVSAQTDISSESSKIDSSSGPARGRDEATDPMPFEYEVSEALTQPGSLRGPGIRAPRVLQVWSGCQNHQNWRLLHAWLARPGQGQWLTG